jgi:hypothetical protein
LTAWKLPLPLGSIEVPCLVSADLLWVAVLFRNVCWGFRQTMELSSITVRVLQYAVWVGIAGLSVWCVRDPLAGKPKGKFRLSPSKRRIIFDAQTNDCCEKKTSEIGLRGKKHQKISDP